MPINAADLLKRLKLLDTSPDAPQNPSQLKLKVPDFKIANSDLSSRITRGSEGTPYPTAGGVNLPSSEGPNAAPMDFDAERLLKTLPSGVEQPAPFKLGSSNTGALGNVEGRQMANSMGLPSSAVRNGAIEPPKMHHGFWDRVKSVGEGALMGMGQIAEQNARSGREQTLESLLGGGAAGGLAGGVSPLSIDALRNQKQADRDMGTLQQKQDLEKGQAQIDDLRRRARTEDPAVERERDDIRQAWQAILASGQLFSPDNPEHKALHDRASALKINLPYGQKSGTRAANAQTGSMVENGVKFQTERDPETNRWVKSVGADGQPIVLDEKPAEKKTGDYSGAIQLRDSLRGQATNIQNSQLAPLYKARTTAQTELGRTPLPDKADPNYAATQDRRIQLDNDIADANKEITRLEGERDRLYGDATKADADAKRADPDQYNKGTSPEQPSEQPTPQQSTPGVGLAPGMGNVSTMRGRGNDPKVQAYADKFFGGNYAAAAAAIAKQRGQ